MEMLVKNMVTRWSGDWARRFKQQVFLSEQLERYYSMLEILFSIENKLVEFLVEQNSDSS